MASVAFSVDAKGTFQICDNTQVLNELGVLLSKIWNGCENCDSCEPCEKINFVVEDLKRTGFDKRTENSLWSIYKETNQYGFEIKKYNNL